MTYWDFYNKNYAACRETVLGLSVEDLARHAIDGRYNRFVGERADLDDRVDAPLKALLDHSHGKIVPYIGWYWRDTRWFDGQIMIGDCGDFIGVIENNKWGYPQRRLTPDEFAQVVAIVDEAMACREDKDAKVALAKLWPLFQTFKIEERASL